MTHSDNEIATGISLQSCPKQNEPVMCGRNEKHYNVGLQENDAQLNILKGMRVLHFSKYQYDCVGATSILFTVVFENSDLFLVQT